MHADCTFFALKNLGQKNISSYILELPARGSVQRSDLVLKSEQEKNICIRKHILMML